MKVFWGIPNDKMFIIWCITPENPISGLRRYLNPELYFFQFDVYGSKPQWSMSHLYNTAILYAEGSRPIKPFLNIVAISNYRQKRFIPSLTRNGNGRISCFCLDFLPSRLPTGKENLFVIFSELTQVQVTHRIWCSTKTPLCHERAKVGQNTNAKHQKKVTCRFVPHCCKMFWTSSFFTNFSFLLCCIVKHICPKLVFLCYVHCCGKINLD